jgi:hypothetical protein
MRAASSTLPRPQRIAGKMKEVDHVSAELKRVR